jgi:arylsulfatase A-like enzyme
MSGQNGRHAKGGAPLNLLFITADQWRGECLSGRGHMVRTPHLDALAADGVRFDRHYTVTVPCGPSRASIHTGLYLQNHRSGTNGTPLDARHTNWAIELRKSGYDPALFGYTDTSQDPRTLPPDHPTLRSYEEVLPGITPVVKMGSDPGPWADYLAERGYDVPKNRALAYILRADGPDYEDGAAHPKPFAVSAEDNDTAWLTRQAIDYIRARKDPWALHLSLLRPHPPWIASEPYNRLYDPMAVPGFERAQTPEAEGDQHPWLAFQLTRRLFRAPGDEKKLRRLKAAYYGLMTEVDHHMGLLIAALKEMGQYDSTLIIFTSDHGEQMGDHWLLGKCGYFDASYHVPLIIRDPRRHADHARGAVVDAFTESVDLMPTMLEALGADVPAQCDGRSLQSFLATGRPPARWRRETHWEADFRDVENTDAEEALGLTLHQCTLNVLRDERYKYVHFAGLPPLLFDLERDPGEFTNLAGDPAYAGVMLDCAQRMLSWRMVHDEQTLTHLKVTDEGVKARAAPRG